MVKQGPNVNAYNIPLLGAAWPEGNIVFVCGGGGSASTGVKNRLVWAKFENGTLSDQLGQVDFGDDTPTSLALDPSNKFLLVGMVKSGIKRFDLEYTDDNVTLTQHAGQLQQQLSDIASGGEVSRVKLSGSGEYLAVAFQEGGLKVYDWPSLKIKIDTDSSSGFDDEAAAQQDDEDAQQEPSSKQPARPDPVKDLDFSPLHKDKLLAVTTSSGVLQLWDVPLGKLHARISMQRSSVFNTANCVQVQDKTGVHILKMKKGVEGLMFSKVRFQRKGGMHRQMITLAVDRSSNSHLVRWVEDQQVPGRYSVHNSTLVAKAPCTALDISQDTRYMATVSAEGQLLVIDTVGLTVAQTVKDVHKFAPTNVVFSSDGQHVLSTAADAGAAVTKVKQVQIDLGTRAILLIALLLLLALVLTAWSVIADMQPQYKQRLAELLGPLAGLLGLGNGQPDNGEL